MNEDKGHDVKYEIDGQLFVWNSIKYNENKIKHKITFEEAATVFMADDTEYFDDEEHSYDEDRFIAIGISHCNNLLMVCHCTRESGTVTRIISARKAEKYEQKQLRW